MILGSARVSYNANQIMILLLNGFELGRRHSEPMCVYVVYVCIRVNGTDIMQWADK